MSDKALHRHLGGYDAISAIADHLLTRLQADWALGSFWDHMRKDGVSGARQLLIYVAAI